MHRVLTRGHVGRLSDYIRNIAPSLFLQELCATPGSIGAICPSSRYLASQMARQVPVDDSGLIIELGAGTGAITQALLDHGIAPERLLVVEYSGSFVQRLRTRFPQIKV